jgi:hypothetical protein
MSLAFMSGLYTGLGKGLEEFNKNEQARAKTVVANTKAANQQKKDNDAKEVKWGTDTAKAFQKIEDDIAKTKGSDSKLSLEERKNQVNKLQKRKRDMVSQIGSNAAKLGYKIPEALTTADYSNYTEIDGKWTNDDQLAQVKDNPNLTIKDGKVFQKTGGEIFSIDDATGKEDVTSPVEYSETGMEFQSMEDVFATKDIKDSIVLGTEEKATRWFDTEYARLKESNPKEFKKKRADFIEKTATRSTAGKGAVKEDMDTDQAEAAITEGINLIAGTDKNKVNKLKATQRKILRNVSTKDEASLTKTRDELRAEAVTIESLDDINTLVKEKIDSKTYKRGLIDNVIHGAKALTGLTDEDKDIIGTIDVNTRVGFIKAMFVKAISGATVSDTERAEYMKMFYGGNWSDETTAKATLKAMTDTMKGYHIKKAKKTRDTLPHEYNNSLKYKKQKSYSSSFR